METDFASPPRDDEVDVSLFGPGYGECVVVHVGGGDWVLIDSCRDVTGKQPALQYLRQMGLEPARAVKLIVVTHWHDDHVRLLSDVVRECPETRIVLSTALRSEEFIALTRILGGHGVEDLPLGGGVRELASVIDALRARRHSDNTDGPIWAIADRALWARRGTADVPAASIHALSPSDASVTRAIQAFGGLLPRQGARPHRVSDPSPNHTSVVLWIHVGDKRVLLGADLEETGRPTEGWSAILNSTGRPDGAAEVFKVPHHGSSNAHSDQVWDELLHGDQPVAVLTPWRLGGNALPSEKDAARICQRTSRAYITTKHVRPRPIRRPRALERAIRDTVMSIQPAVLKSGRVTVRGQTSGRGDWTTTMVSPAMALCPDDKGD
ncbi:MAG: MBL fold metallo-hydrolase [Dehalococcoidia bacterium]